MIQILIGSSSYSNSLSLTYSSVVEDPTFDQISAKILEGLKKSIHLLTDISIIDMLEGSPIESIMDLKCLQSYMADQDVKILVTNVSSDILSEGSKIVKVVSPTFTDLNIPDATDFAFEDKILMEEVVSTIRDKYNLYNPQIFIESPLSVLINDLSSAELEGSPSSEILNQLIDELEDLGFKVYVIYNDEE